MKIMKQCNRCEKDFEGQFIRFPNICRECGTPSRIELIQYKIDNLKHDLEDLNV